MVASRRPSSSLPRNGPLRRSQGPLRLVLATALAVVASGWFASPAAAQIVLTNPPGTGPIAFVVRHAERAPDPPDDPVLSPAGRERAALLATMLKDVYLTAIYSSPWQRTRETAAAVALVTGLPVQEYDPRDADSMAAMAEAIRSGDGRVLVVGHSNTVESTVELLGGTPQGPVADDEYDRLYVLTPAATEGGTTLLLRFGTPWKRPGG